jgi:GAF domain-containing protein
VTDNDLQAAVAAGVMTAEGEQRALLASIVSVARSIFRAKAASVFLYDQETDELVFEAVSGEGAQSLVGTRLPSGTGVAGWVLTTREPLIINDTTKDSRFARDAAERTGFVPESLMCAPLTHGDRALGVINVLDRPLRPGFALEEIDLLGQFAHQAALALLQLERARRVRRVLAGQPDEVQAVARLADVLARASSDTRRAERTAFLVALTDVLRGSDPTASPAAGARRAP